MNRFITEKMRSRQAYHRTRPFIRSASTRTRTAYALSETVRKKIAEAVAGILLTRYPDPMAEEVCRKFAALHNLGPENVVAGNGSDEIIGRDL
jgi:histidinol-phosphate aminotransferase